MPAGNEAQEHRIVVGVDGSPSSRMALRWAGSVMDAVIAWHDPPSYGGHGWLITDTSYAVACARPAGLWG
jgi:hypothetical protein